MLIGKETKLIFPLAYLPPPALMQATSCGAGLLYLTAEAKDESSKEQPGAEPNYDAFWREKITSLKELANAREHLQSLSLTATLYSCLYFFVQALCAMSVVCCTGPDARRDVNHRTRQALLRQARNEK